MSEPYINLYIGDIIRDTSGLSAAAFGAYMKLLFQMHLSKDKGKVVYSSQALCRVTGLDMADIEEFLNELIDNNICDYENNGNHVFVSRRMIRESSISKLRKEIGSKGGKQTQSKSKKLAKPKEEAKTKQNTGIGIGNGIGINSIKKSSEVFKSDENSETKLQTTGTIYLVPAMLNVWRIADPRYPIDKDRDYQPLQEIADFITKQQNEQTTAFAADTFSSIVETWKTLAAFIVEHKLFKSYSLQQMSRHIQGITQAYKYNENDRTGVNASNHFAGKGATITQLQVLKEQNIEKIKEDTKTGRAANNSLTDDYD